MEEQKTENREIPKKQWPDMTDEEYRADLHRFIDEMNDCPYKPDGYTCQFASTTPEPL